jgi:4-amino-4-deoxy-L-arabinose transferase-like glycosyltransferase
MAAILQNGVRRPIWLPGLILCTLAIVLRLVVATQREGIEIDGITYLSNAQLFLQDWRAVNVLHPPLYSLIMAPFYGLWSDPEWGARVVSAVLGGLWVWPMLWLAREVTDEEVSWKAGLLVALMPSAIDASTRVLSEATFGLFLTAFLASLARTLRKATVGPAALTGVLGALATLARPEGMSYLVLVWGLLLLAPAVVGRLWTSRTVLTRITTITVLWLAVMLPYMTLVRNQTGHWHWSGKGAIILRFAEGIEDEKPGAFFERSIVGLREEDLPKGLLAYIIDQPERIIRRVVLNLHHLDKYVLPGLLQSGGIVLVVVGLLHLRFQRAPAPLEWFLPVSLLPLAGLLLYLVSTRFFVPIIPILSIIAAIGLARVGQHATFLPPRLQSRAGALLLIVVLISYGPWIVRPWFRQDLGAVEKAAGLWLRNVSRPGTVFIGSYGRIAYYADARGIQFGKRSLDELLTEGRKAGARFLIVDNVTVPESRPDLLALVAGERGARQDLEMAHAEEDRAGHRVIIYRVKE